LEIDGNPLNQEVSMAFRPNYYRDRAERDRSARARTAEKMKRREEKSALRKALRAAAEAPEQPAERDTESLTEKNDKDSASTPHFSERKYVQK
jgi:hypothetical protein